MEQLVCWSLILIEGTTEKVYKFYTLGAVVK